MATLRAASNDRRLRRYVDVTRTLILLSVLFVAGWLPMLFVCAIDRDHSRFHLTWHRLAHDGAEITSCLYPFFCMLRIAELRVTARDMMFCSSNKQTRTLAPNRSTIRTLIVSVSRVMSAIIPEAAAPRVELQLSVRHLPPDRGHDL